MNSYDPVPFSTCLFGLHCANACLSIPALSARPRHSIVVETNPKSNQYIESSPNTGGRESTPSEPGHIIDRKINSVARIVCGERDKHIRTETQDEKSAAGYQLQIVVENIQIPGRLAGDVRRIAHQMGAQGCRSQSERALKLQAQLASGPYTRSMHAF